MAYEQKDNSGSLFKNRNPKGDNSPPLTGSAMIGGVEYWVSGWAKNDKNGDRYVSFTFKAKNPSAAQAQTSKPALNIDEDSIPFK